MLGQKLPNIIGRYPIKIVGGDGGNMQYVCSPCRNKNDRDWAERKCPGIYPNIVGYKLKRISSHFLPIELYELQREHDVAKG